MDTRLCPHCNACIGEDEIICPFCDEELVSFGDDEDDMEGEIFQDEAEEKEECMYCGVNENLPAEKHFIACPVNIHSWSTDKATEKATREWEDGWSDGSSAREQKKSGSPSYRLGHRRGYATVPQPDDH
jgi:hypothetical protein